MTGTPRSPGGTNTSLDGAECKFIVTGLRQVGDLDCAATLAGCAVPNALGRHFRRQVQCTCPAPAATLQNGLKGAFGALPATRSLHPGTSQPSPEQLLLWGPGKSTPSPLLGWCPGMSAQA